MEGDGTDDGFGFVEKANLEQMSSGSLVDAADDSSLVCVRLNDALAVQDAKRLPKRRLDT